MTKFVQMAVSEQEQFNTYLALADAWSRNDADVRRSFPAKHLGEAAPLIKAFVEKESAGPVWRNDVYQVLKRDHGDWLCLSIKRIDREPIHDWRELQQIKTELLGADVEAVELYPREDRVVDTANQYYLWARKEPGGIFPFGFNEGRIVTDRPLFKSKQRPFDNET